MTDAQANARAKAGLRLWLRLLDCSNLIERDVRIRLREQAGFTLPQFDLLAALEREPPGQGLTMSELSKRLRVSNGNVTGVVARLEQSGMIHRRTPSRDRRTALIALTEEGRAKFYRTAQAHERWIDAILVDVPTQQREQLTDMLKHVVNSARAGKIPQPVPETSK